MAKEAEANAEEDKKKREKAESKVQLDNAVYQAEKLVRDNGDKIGEDDKKTINEAVEEAKKLSLRMTLTKTSMKLRQRT
jgi:molecular chaperone DnaK